MSELPKLPLILAHTSLNHYLTCPKRFYHMYIAKDAAEKKTFQQTTGIDVHEAMRKRLKLREPLPDSYKEFEGLCVDLDRQAGTRYIEQRLAIGADGTACDYDAPVARFRGIADVVLSNGGVAFILDWKTGKPWEEPLELRTLAVLVKARYRDVKRVTGAFYWMREKRMGPPHPVIDDTAKTWRDLTGWANSIARRIEKNDWPADENPLCAWCSCSKEQCQHRKDRPS